MWDKGGVRDIYGGGGVTFTDADGREYLRLLAVSRDRTLGYFPASPLTAAEEAPRVR
jgi:hypothetical protein